MAARHDALIDEANRMGNMATRFQWLGRAQVYADELTRRDTVRLTRSLNGFTWVITVATIIGVALTAWTLLSGA